MVRELITVDIDDVVADTTEAFRLVVNEHTGADLTTEDYRVPNPSYSRYYEQVWEDHGLAVDYAEVSAPMQIDQAHVALVAGAKQAIEKLAARYRIALITGRSASWEAATRHYISAKFEGLEADIHFAKRREGISKGQICRQLGASWHIDDNPADCQSVLDESKSTEAILFGEYGWHQDVSGGFIRCKNWLEVMEYFDGRNG